MSDVHPIEDLFGELIALETPEQRQKFLDKVCEDDTARREQLEKLVAAHEQAGSFLQEGETAEPTVDSVSEDLTGTTIGPYKLRERLGTGGMGVVWAAERKQPIRQKVAIKVIKPGMDSECVIARFEAERAALALMDHPNIARVLDAGTTEQGHPYFVMELIRGVPITEYCDAKQMNIHERLQLFMQVCRAVQHAHQKGIIHRDIKPNNILVGEHDGEPFPKVIDFGVAKALHQPLTDRSVYTGVFQAIGTLAYMSPEQAGLSVTDIDTRADIYGLGVLLYELVTGSTPFDKDELASAAFDEACRIIREKAPPKPSTRISTLGEMAATISQERGTDPTGLGSLVRGDLDWIVTKALEKERGRRYETAEALAVDVQKQMSNEPIDARPPSAAYVLSRFYRRNKTGVTVVVAMVALLLLAILGTTTGWRRATVERQRAEAAREIANLRLRELNNVLKIKAIEYAMAGREEDAKRALNALSLNGNDKAWEPFILGHLDFYNGKVDRAVVRFQEACRLGPEFVAAKSMLAVAYVIAGQSVQFSVELEDLSDRVTDNAVDELYMIQAHMYGRANTNIAIERLDKYFADHPYTPIARLIRAEVLTHKVIYEGDLEAARRATTDANVALEEMPGTPMAQTIGLFAHMFAVKLYQQHNLSERACESLAIGIRLAEQLEKSRWLSSQITRAHFYGDCLHDLEQEQRAWEEAYKLGLRRSPYLDQYMMFLLRSGRYKNFDDDFDSPVDLGVVLAMALLRAEDEASRETAIRRITEFSESDGKVDPYTAAVLSLLGCDVRHYAERGFKPIPQVTAPKESRPFLGEFFRGEIDKDQLIATCRANGIVDLTFVRLCAAMKLIGNKDAGAARQLLQEAGIDSSDPWSAGFATSVLARLEDDVRWPYLEDESPDAKDAPR